MIASVVAGVWVHSPIPFLFLLALVDFSLNQLLHVGPSTAHLICPLQHRNHSLNAEVLLMPCHIAAPLDIHPPLRIKPVATVAHPLEIAECLVAEDVTSELPNVRVFIPDALGIVYDILPWHMPWVELDFLLVMDRLDGFGWHTGLGQLVDDRINVGIVQLAQADERIC